MGKTALRARCDVGGAGRPRRRAARYRQSRPIHGDCSPMTSSNSPIIDQQPHPPRAGRDDLAYIAPMAVFLAFVWAAGQWPKLYAPLYFVKTFVVTIVLIALWKHYTRIRWNYLWLGAIVGVIGIFQWVGMQLALQKLV